MFSDDLFHRERMQIRFADVYLADKKCCSSQFLRFMVLFPARSKVVYAISLLLRLWQFIRHFIMLSLRQYHRHIQYEPHMVLIWGKHDGFRFGVVVQLTGWAAIAGKDIGQLGGTLVFRQSV